VEGAKRIFQQGCFTQCDVCNECGERHRVDSDPFLQFIDEEAQLGVDQRIATAVLYNRYVEFCKENGRMSKGSAEFGKQVTSLNGVTKRRRGGGARGYEYWGISLVKGCPRGYATRPMGTVLHPYQNN